jgi:dolichyl-phosphate beta-glucosyltransferase
LAKPFLSVIVPAYNEERRIGPTLEKLVGFLSAQTYEWEVIVVENGSDDGTAQVVGSWAAEVGQVRLESLPIAGKGLAVRHGMLRVTGEYRFMCDADMSMPVEYLEDFLARMAEGNDGVIGSRQIEGARRFGEPAGRHLMGRVFNWVVRLVAVGGFQDTQCGFKMFRGDVAEDLFGKQRTTGWGFDVEILYIARKRGLRILEMPIDWYHEPSSKINPVGDSIQMVKDVVLARWRGIIGTYR